MLIDEAISRLHDAVLEGIDIGWQAPTARVRLTLVPGPRIALVAEGLRSVRLSRDEPWGPSAYLNGGVIRQGHGEPVVLELEMQSGDAIVIGAERLVVEM